MRNIIFIIISFFEITTLSAQSIPKVNLGSIVRIENLQSKYIDTRNIDIWLPEGYNKKKKYAVLYMQDGQMLYDSTITWNKKSWLIDTKLSALIKEHKIKNTIVVGIWNGDKKRHSEYFPQKPFESLTDAERDTIINAARNNYASVFNNYKISSDNYLKFIVEELKPLIDNKFSTRKNRDNTFIGGSSMGGLISMYALCEYPNVFGGAICMSTHWPGIFSMVNNPIPVAFINYLDANLPNPKTHKIYFDYGDQTLDALYPPIQVKVDDIMKKKGWDKANWMTQFFKGQNHSEDAWSSRIQIPLLFMLSNK